MGVTTKELGKLLETGQVMASELLPKLSLELMKTFRPTAAMLDSPQASINRMKQAFIDLAKVVGESGLNKALSVVSKKLEAFAKSDAAVKLGKQLGEVLIWLSENFESLAKTAGYVIGILTIKTAINTTIDTYRALITVVGGVGSALASMGIHISSVGALLNTVGIDIGKLIPLLKQLGALALYFGAGFAVGKGLTEYFVEARIAGTYLLQGVMAIWEGIKLGGQLVYSSLSLITMSYLSSVSSAWISFGEFVVDIFDKIAEKIEAVFNSNFVKSAASGLDQLFGTDMFSKASVSAADFFGKTVGGGIDKMKEGLKDAFGFVNDATLTSVKQDVENLNSAWSTFTETLMKDGATFDDIRSDYEKQGELAEKLGINIGDLEEYLNKQTKAALEAAEATRALSKAEEERLARIRVLEDKAKMGDGVGAVEKMKEVNDIIAEAKGAVDPTAAAINKLNDKLAKLNRTIAESPNETKKMTTALDLFNKKLAEQKAELAKIQPGDSENAYALMGQAIQETKGYIEQLSEGLAGQPAYIKAAYDAVAILTDQLNELNKTDTQKALNDIHKGLDETIKYADSLTKHYKILGDAEEELAVRRAILAGANDEQIEQLRKKLKEASKAMQDLNLNKDIESSIKGMFNSLGYLGDELVDGVAKGDWSGLGSSIAKTLGDTMSDILSTSIGSALGNSLGALAGPLGSLVGGVVGSVIEGVISGDLFGQIEDPTEKLQKEQSTGGVLGDSTAKTESIIKSLDMIESTNEKILGINTGMLNALRSLRQDINKVSALLAGSMDNTQSSIRGPAVGDNVFRDGGGAGAVIGTILGGLVGGLPALLSGVNGFMGEVGKGLNDALSVLTFGLSDVIGKYFAGSSRKVDEGIRILGGSMADLMDGVIVDAYATFAVKRHRWDNASYMPAFQAVDDDINNQFNMIFTSISNSVTKTALGLGLKQAQITDAMNKFELPEIRISTEDADYQEQLEGLFSDVFDRLSESVMPFVKSFRQGGESFGDTATRLSTELALANEAYAAMGITLDSTMGDIMAFPSFMGAAGEALANMATPAEVLLNAADDLVNAVGGIDAFSEALAGFEANFLSEAENFQNLTRRLGDAMGSLPLPDTRDGFKALMAAQNGVDAASVQNRATLLSLQGVADGYYDTLESWSDRIKEAFRGVSDIEISDEALAGYIAQLKAGDITIDELVASMKGQGQAAEELANLDDLNLRLLKAQSTEQEWLNITRANEIAEMEGLANATEAIDLLRQIHAAEDAAKAAEELAKAEEELTKARLDATKAAIDAFDSIGFQAFNLDGSDLLQEQIEAASQALVNGVGDIAAFNSAVSTFSNNFITEEARLSNSTTKLTNKFAEFGMSVPATRAEFTGLLQSLNAMTEGGQVGISTLLSLTEAADLYYKNQEALAERMYNLDIRLLKAQGKEAELLAKTRQKELDSATDAEKAILRQIYVAEDLTALREEELSVQDQLTEVKNRLNDSYREEISNLEGVRDTMRGLGDSLRDFGTELSLGDLSSLSPQDQLALARKNFEMTASAAQSGDESALSRLQEVSQAFLDESREFQGSGGTYAQDFAKVQEVVSASASMADLQASQAERQRVLLERQLQRQEENNVETRSIKEALLALIAVQKETGVLSLSELNAIGNSLAVLESNSALSTSQL